MDDTGSTAVDPMHQKYSDDRHTDCVKRAIIDRRRFEVKWSGWSQTIVRMMPRD
ncbi:hypothetical protein KIN20_022611 [Parelaphostrongylus tenuis]|uniref:Uncharacterized protein n=1 Tax=Parelaphostrongylus tenuis TaxID=148309 RepID=A0AAD5QSC9_PARTN|nr:hypothetical protein KIN20_022611 [Parelaphostrongylus tenuis]